MGDLVADRARHDRRHGRHPEQLGRTSGARHRSVGAGQQRHAVRRRRSGGVVAVPRRRVVQHRRRGQDAKSPAARAHRAARRSDCSLAAVERRRARRPGPRHKAVPHAVDHRQPHGAHRVRSGGAWRRRRSARASERTLGPAGFHRRSYPRRCRPYGGVRVGSAQRCTTNGAGDRPDEPLSVHPRGGAVRGRGLLRDRPPIGLTQSGHHRCRRQCVAADCSTGHDRHRRRTTGFGPRAGAPPSTRSRLSPPGY